MLEPRAVPGGGGPDACEAQDRTELPRRQRDGRQQIRTAAAAAAVLVGLGRLPLVTLHRARALEEAGAEEERLEQSDCAGARGQEA